MNKLPPNLQCDFLMCRDNKRATLPPILQSPDSEIITVWASSSSMQLSATKKLTTLENTR